MITTSSEAKVTDPIHTHVPPRENPMSSGFPARRGSEVQFTIEPNAGRPKFHPMFTVAMRTTVPMTIHFNSNCVNVGGLDYFLSSMAWRWAIPGYRT